MSSIVAALHKPGMSIYLLSGNFSFSIFLWSYFAIFSHNLQIFSCHFIGVAGGRRKQAKTAFESFPAYHLQIINFIFYNYFLISIMNKGD